VVIEHPQLGKVEGVEEKRFLTHPWYMKREDEENEFVVWERGSQRFWERDGWRVCGEGGDGCLNG